MKYKMIAVLAVICCAAAGAFAQDIDGLLAKMPADNADAFNAACADMLAAGPEAIKAMAARLVPMGQGDDNAARYAISGLAKYVTRPGAESERQVYAKALDEALQADQPAEVKQFLMHQLELAGGQESVPVLKSFLDDPDLGGPASRALASIGVTADPTVGEKVPAATASDNPDIAKAQQLFAAGKDRDAAKLLENLVESKDTTSPVRVDALKMLVTERQRAAIFPLIAAGTSDDAALRAAALDLAPRIDGTVATKKWGRALDDASPEAQVDILNMLGKRADADAVPAIANVFREKDHAVSMAAIQALEAIGSEKAIDALQEVRRATKDTEEMAAAKNALRHLDPESVWTPEADAEGFLPLFNGKDLSGWTGHLGGYDIQEGGVIATRKNALNLYTEDAYGNFVLRFDFKLTPGANNGIGIRVPLYGHAAYDGMEIQVIDDSGYAEGELKPYQYHGSVYGIVPAAPGHLNPVGEWNSEEITVDGAHVTVVLNGATIVDADVVAAAQPQPLDHKDHPGLERDSGHISFAGHNSEVYFRNVRIKPLP